MHRRANSCPTDPSAVITTSCHAAKPCIKPPIPSSRVQLTSTSCHLLIHYTRPSAAGFRADALSFHSVSLIFPIKHILWISTAHRSLLSSRMAYAAATATDLPVTTIDHFTLLPALVLILICELHQRRCSMLLPWTTWHVRGNS